MKKQILMIMLVVGVLIGGCHFPQEVSRAEFDKQNTAELKIQNQRQQYFDEHLNLSPWMKQYVTNKDKLYFKPPTEEDYIRNIEFEYQAAESTALWMLLICLL